MELKDNKKRKELKDNLERKRRENT